LKLAKTETIKQVIEINSGMGPVIPVWGFSLYTHGDRKYIAYYNANRNLVVDKEILKDEDFGLHIIPPQSRETSWRHKYCFGGMGKQSQYLVYRFGIDKEWVSFIFQGTMPIQIPINLFQKQTRNDISTRGARKWK